MNFYHDNAKAYYQETIANNVSELRNEFLTLLPSNAHILDLGCGSGRDSRFFIDSGYRVSALEASQPLAQLAAKHIGQPVIVQRYQQLSGFECYDGIWACASLLHCSKQQISDVFTRCINTLKPGGVWYMSFKYGQGERLDERGRFFNNYSATELEELLSAFAQLDIKRIWEESKSHNGYLQHWTNCLVRKHKDEQ